MDKWNRYDKNEYTGISAQRRNRRRTGSEPAAPEMPSRKPAFPEKTADGTKAAFSASPAYAAEKSSLERIRRFMKPETPAEPEAAADGEEFAEQTVIEEPEVFEFPEETGVTEDRDEPAESAEPEDSFETEEPAVPETDTDPEEPDVTEEPAEPEETAGQEAYTEPEETVRPEEEAGREDSGEPETPEEPVKAEEPSPLSMQETRREPAYVVQGADSRVPPEARRMAETPYGTAGDAARPDTRVRIAQRRPVRSGETKAAVRPRYESSSARPQAGTQQAGGQRSRVHVGYAPGRMSDDMTQQIPTGEAVRESLYTRDARAYLEKRKQPFRVEENVRQAPERPGARVLGIVVALLVLAGAVLTGMMLQKNRDGSGGQVIREAPRVISFEALDVENRMAPTDLMFKVVTDKNADGIRLRGEDDKDLDTDAESVDESEGRLWQMRFHVEYGFTGTVRLQVQRIGDEYWYDTDYTSDLNVVSMPGVEPTATPGPSEEEDDDYYNPDEETPEPGAEGEDGPAADNPEGDSGENVQQQGPEEEPPRGNAEDEQTNESEDNGELPAGALRTQVPTSTPAPATPEPTKEPPLAAEAAPEANPALITATTVYTSATKKVKEYSRPAKELIHMPAADEYSKRQLGVLTFRGDNFRRNAAAGTLSADPVGLGVLWQTEAGSARGANQYYYGYEWTGQPVIARWSTEVRDHSNITEAKRTKKALKEVIIAGVDGAIRFLDLEDGQITRNSIKLGYPMKGTPSLHPRGYPFMSVGQFARKMKSKTGKIGLRQYNLFSQRETKLIDGLDGKYHRPLNNVGSFETSALIDRESDTLIAVGTNGMLYLESLGSTFDYNMGIMTISPSTTAMTSKAKGQKNTALMAVESSPAAYDKYVFYADMGGVLRCVDTNTLKPVWAVDTGDSVMAAVAMDMTGNGEADQPGAGRTLNLYTANMLNNRKKGNSSIQIRRYDAMSGKQAWSTDIGVYKGKKDKDDVGAKASPVIGQRALGGLVYFTVTGLSEEGVSKLGLHSDAKAALIALDKDTGSIAWSFGLSSRSESSPLALYDEAGNGWIIQCEQSGKVHLLDGLSGEELSGLELDGEIMASPAAYNNVVVIGTTGKKTSFVYGIEVKLDHLPEEAAEEPQAEAAAEPQDAEDGGQPEDVFEDIPEDDGDMPEDGDELPEDEYDDAQEGGAEDEEVPGGA